MIINLQQIYLVYRIEDSKMDRTCSREIINAQNILNTDNLKIWNRRKRKYSWLSWFLNTEGVNKCIHMTV
jgi:hypothetical protein